MFFLHRPISIVFLFVVVVVVCVEIFDRSKIICDNFVACVSMWGHSCMNHPRFH